MNVKTLLRLMPILGGVLVGGCAHVDQPSIPPQVETYVISGAWDPANPDPAPALPRGVYDGEYIHGFETSAFIACGSTVKWWTEGVWNEVTAFEKQHPEIISPTGWRTSRLYLRVVGTPSATGNYGHLGSYPRQFDVDQLLELREYREGDCTGQGGA